jgi:hypothetical protein
VVKQLEILQELSKPLLTRVMTKVMAMTQAVEQYKPFLDAFCGYG